ncbi:hypothetical protein SSABA_v1c04430 [Spiroplasma sabaudiense Ar-1343]|uniref:Uncharacterized protein n=2 Tax=Spiroplasma sabaudiense TaxID=216944 RepID=W6AAH9_9MOLU|nr:hypothetical protein SSABA_v1c04430 [Spiroplasma sabaudiense Ar-1343]
MNILALISFIFGFASDINSQNELDFILSDLWIKNSFENTNFWILFIKSIYDILKTLILWGFIIIIEEKIASFKTKTCSNQPKIIETKGVLKEFFKIIAMESRFWGVKMVKIDSQNQDSRVIIKQNFLLESAESLFKSINPFGIFNVFVISLIAQNLEINFLQMVLSLFKFNWIIYFLVFTMIFLNLIGRWSDFLFKNWEIDYSKLKNFKRAKIQVR